jgi:hypothetical protein
VDEILARAGIFHAVEPDVASALTIRMHKALVLISGPDDGSSDDTISREDLTGCRLIVSQRGSLMRALVADVLASGIDVSVVAEIAHRTSILPMVLNGLGRAVLPASWTASARRSGARVQTITLESYLHVAAVSRRTHLTTPATALMIEARAYAAQAARQTSGPHGGDQPVAASVNEPHHRDICAVAVLTDNDAAFRCTAPRGRTALEITLGTAGIKYSTSRPYHPQTCGKVDRIHQTQKKWLTARRSPVPTAGQYSAVVDSRYRRAAQCRLGRSNYAVQQPR